MCIMKCRRFQYVDEKTGASGSFIVPIVPSNIQRLVADKETRYQSLELFLGSDVYVFANYISTRTVNWKTRNYKKIILKSEDATKITIYGNNDGELSPSLGTEGVRTNGLNRIGSTYHNDGIDYYVGDSTSYSLFFVPNGAGDYMSKTFPTKDSFTGAFEFLAVDENFKFYEIIFSATRFGMMESADFTLDDVIADTQYTVEAFNNLIKNVESTIEDIDTDTEPDPEPEPERSTLDMFDTTGRFSPRAQISAMGNYILDKTDVDALMSDLWSSTIIEKFNYKVFGNPLDSILSLKWYYGIRNDINKTKLKVPLTIGNLDMRSQSGDSANIRVHACASEYVTFNFGVIDIDSYRETKNIKRNDYLDYAPFVRYQLYLPYVGYIDLNPNEIVDGVLGVKLNINLLTGQGLYTLYTYNNEHNITSDFTYKQVILTVPCSVAVEVPISIDSMNSLSATVAMTIGSAVATGLGAASSGVLGAAAGGASSAMLAGAGVASDAIGDLMETPDSKRNGGAYNPDTGNLGALQPYLLITLPIIATPAGFTDVLGNRAAVTDMLSNCTGFTQIIGAVPSDNEQRNKYQSEIIALLQSGVYL